MEDGERILYKRYEQEFQAFCHNPKEPDVTEESFLALNNIFENLARQQLPDDPGRFFFEVLRMVLRQSDLETWRACMVVSTSFRDLCQYETLSKEEIDILSLCLAQRSQRGISYWILAWTF